MEIILNGEPHKLNTVCNVSDLIASLALQGKGVAVAINREIVPRGTWSTRVLATGEQVEIVKAIGGG